MTQRDLLQICQADSINAIHNSKKLKKKKQRTISIDAEKPLTKPNSYSG